MEDIMSNEIKVFMLAISLCYSQCDADGDGLLNVIDVVVEVNCILNDCWGETYNSVWIGGQHWMAENLNVTHYNNGDVITNIEWDDGWTYNHEPACADYDEDPSNSDVYGKLYNWYAVDDDRGICPDGWHIPSQTEYTQLIEYLGGSNIAGYLMKDNTWDGSSQSEFHGLPGGCRASGPANGDCCMGVLGQFWTSTPAGIDAIYVELETNKDAVVYNYKDKRAGKSVRCLQD